MAKQYHVTIINANPKARRRLAEAWLAGIRAAQRREIVPPVSETMEAGKGYVRKPQ